MPNSDLSLEKLKIHERLTSMEEGDKLFRSELRETMQEIKLRTTNVELMIHGDPAKIDKYTRDGINRRLEALEASDSKEQGVKKEFRKTAIGAITIAVGGAIIWIFDVVRHAFIAK